MRKRTDSAGEAMIDPISFPRDENFPIPPMDLIGGTADYSLNLDDLPKWYRNNITQQGLQDFLDNRSLDEIRQNCRERSRAVHTPIISNDFDFEKLSKVTDKEVDEQIRAAGAEHRTAINELSIYNGSMTFLTLMAMADHLQSKPDIEELRQSSRDVGYDKSPLLHSMPYPREFPETIELIAGQFTIFEREVRAQLGEEFTAAYNDADIRGKYYHAMLCTLNEEWQKRHGERHYAVLERLLDIDPRSYLNDWQTIFEQEISAEIDDRIYNVKPAAKGMWAAALAIEREYPDISSEEVIRILLKNASGELGYLARGRIATTEIVKMDMQMHYKESVGLFSTLIEYALSSATGPKIDENDSITFSGFDMEKKGRCPIQYHVKIEEVAQGHIQNFLDLVEADCGARPNIMEGDYVAIAPFFTAMIVYYAAQEGGFLRHGVKNLTEQFLQNAEHQPGYAW